MSIAYNLLLALGIIIAVIFTVLVIFTGKGDAMSGGSGVRTTFKGRATFEDLMSNICLGLGIAFMAVTFLINILSVHIKW